MLPDPELTARLDRLLPQTQCTKCGFAGCAPYAAAMASGEAAHNRCPPGGADGIARLAAALDAPIVPLDPATGTERPRPLARIDERICIGCTLCMQACPVDAIVGAPKQMHTVLADWCTGCDLCVAPCPVDCISMEPVSGDATGWDAWSQAQADTARRHFDARNARLARERAAKAERVAQRAQAASTASDALTQEDAAAAKRRAIVAAAVARARARREAEAQSHNDREAQP
ncbi:electron transport complex subunit RsxB [Chitinasiproducens palmae]|uniref:electron transport complex subunit RsxB n=1 Tax=Chitinasiproducens palmae TaxID=1770053 RepID=UPI001F29EFB6|nr:electron transport complex subunit RsxB [Chitinasiproducens palmae]